MADDDFFNAYKSEYNCYAYAVGDKESPSDVIGSIPGAAGGDPMKRITVSDMTQGLIKDGAIPVEVSMDEFPPAKEGHRLIAAVISPGGNGDFHFYRQEADGYWSHKPARTEVQYTDASGSLIEDPRYAKRDYREVLINGLKWPLNYSHFGGFFYVPEDGLKTGKAPPPAPNPASQMERMGCESSSYPRLDY